VGECVSQTANAATLDLDNDADSTTGQHKGNVAQCRGNVVALLIPKRATKGVRNVLINNLLLRCCALLSGYSGVEEKLVRTGTD
jgi:hypothetical protein